MFIGSPRWHGWAVSNLTCDALDGAKVEALAQAVVEGMPQWRSIADRLIRSTIAVASRTGFGLRDVRQRTDARIPRGIRLMHE